MKWFLVRTYFQVPQSRVEGAKHHSFEYDVHSTIYELVRHRETTYHENDSTYLFFINDALPIWLSLIIILLCYTCKKIQSRLSDEELFEKEELGDL